ncbi:MAG: hypothetical protein GC161_18380 [Planctomycetaceae bacterium]|nr:hypothetical protein [Planctomycetaceae bacterium]
MGFRALAGLTNNAVQGLLGGAVVFYLVPGQPPREVRGLFDREHYSASAGEAPQLSSTQPSITFTVEDLTAAGIEPRGGEAGHNVIAAAVDGGGTWRVIDVQPDGLGMVVCTLHQAAPYDEEDEDE